MFALGSSTTPKAAKPALQSASSDRLCPCGESIAHLGPTARYCDNTCGSRYRQRQKRQRDAENKVASDRRSADTRWQQSLRFEVAIAKVRQAVTDGRVAPDIGRRLQRRLVQDRLGELRGFRHNSGCSHRTVSADEDGDPVCFSCGRYVGRLSISTSLDRDHQFRALDRQMSSRPDSDLTRPIPKRPWRGERGEIWTEEDLHREKARRKPPSCWSRPCRKPAAAPSAFCLWHTGTLEPSREESEAAVRLLPIWQGEASYDDLAELAVAA